MEPGSDVKAKLLGYFAKYTKHYRELYKSQGKAKMAKSRSIQKARGKVWRRKQTSRLEKRERQEHMSQKLANQCLQLTLLDQSHQNQGNRRKSLNQPTLIKNQPRCLRWVATPLALPFWKP